MVHKYSPHSWNWDLSKKAKLLKQQLQISSNTAKLSMQAHYATKRTDIFIEDLGKVTADSLKYVRDTTHCRVVD